MLKFNNNNIFTGYIKQMLASFNLPSCNVYNEYYSKDKPLFKDTIYLYNNAFYRCKEDFIPDESTGQVTLEVFLDKCYKMLPYIENRRFNNLTHNLIVNNNIYDSYTHRYLGDYLRYLRNHKDINLMRLYNCFNNEQPRKLSIAGFTDTETCKYYIIPVKFFEQYTIAISCSTAVEMILCLYNGTSNYNVYSSSLLKKSGLNFYKPFLINTFIDGLTEKDISNEQDLRLIIKLPAYNNSSIVVLEGNYVKDNEIMFKDGRQVVANITYNVGQLNPTAFKNINFQSKSQLLNINDHVSYPFSDRLVEYMFLNPITNIDTIVDNVKRVQLQLKNNGIDNSNTKIIDGEWRDVYRGYCFMLAKKKDLTNTKFDLLGFVDKDVESILGEEPDLYSKEGDI